MADFVQKAVSQCSLIIESKKMERSAQIRCMEVFGSSRKNDPPKQTGSLRYQERPQGFGELEFGEGFVQAVHHP